MSTLPWFPWFPGDYARDTPHLSPEEHAVYRLLLDASWSRGPLPDEIPRLQRMAANASAEAVAFILEHFWVRDDNGHWVNPRLERIRTEQVIAHRRRAMAGRKGGRVRGEDYKTRAQDAESQDEKSNAKSNAEVPAQALAKHCLSNQNQNQNQSSPTSGGGGKEAKKKASKPRQQPVWHPPDGINPQAWKDLEAHRIEIDKPMTNRARDLAARALLAISPQDQQACVDMSIANGWTGIFPERWANKRSALPLNGNGRVPRTQEQWQAWGDDNGIRARSGESWDEYLNRVRAAYAAADHA